MTPAILAGIVGAFFLYGAVTGRDPRELLGAAFGVGSLTGTADLSMPTTMPTPGGGAATGGGSYGLVACPVPGARISDDFGAARYGGGYHTHQGNDLMAPMGAPIHAAHDGVLRRDPNTLGGLAVIVTGPSGHSYYAHLSRYALTAPNGAHVKAGALIGYVGNTGDAKGGPTHCHFEWHPGNGPAVDPHPYLLAVCGG